MNVYQKNCGLLDAILQKCFKGQLEVGNYAKLSSPGFMDLVVEVIGENTVSLTHYYEANGDLITDPEVVVKIDSEHQMVEGLSFEMGALGIYKEVYGRNGQCDCHYKEELNSFLSEWMTTIHHQGFLEGGVKHE